MHQAATPYEEQRRWVATGSTEGADLVAEVLELRVENEQLTRALSSRAVIDQALGMVMALAPCSSERAWGVLVDVSQHCNVKLRDVAAALVATAQGEPLPEQMRRRLRRALVHVSSR